jgi:hypothetical protein
MLLARKITNKAKSPTKIQPTGVENRKYMEPTRNDRVKLS